MAVKPADHPQSARSRFRFVSVRSEEELPEHIDAWDDLARLALEANVFFESWFLLPAVRAFGAGQKLLFVLVYEPSAKRPGQEVLAGFFPLVESHGYKGLPVRMLILWHHAYSVFGAPLLRRESAQQCLTAFLDWAGANPHRAGLVQFPLCPGEGPFHQALVKDCFKHTRHSFINECYPRAFFTPRSDTATYRAMAISGHHNREMRRLERSLRKFGVLEFRVLNPSDDLAAWTGEFERLEASGWKGKEGTAFSSRDADQLFFRTILTAGFARGQLMMLGLFLNGRPIALKCNLLAGDGSFAFKIAYDETLARYSPGVLLELFNIDYLHCHSEIRWMDSCAVPGHPMIERLWLDRRIIQDTLLSTGRGPGDFIVSVLPGLRWVKRQVSSPRRFTGEPEPHIEVKETA